MKKVRKPLIIGNWKTNPATLQDAVTFVKTLERKLSTKKIPGLRYFLAAPDIFVPSLISLAKKGGIGVQNISGTTTGEETGLTTAGMIASTKASFAIVGHSEVRRRGEELHTLSQKVALSLKQKLMTVLCVGEESRDKNGEYLSTLEQELKETIKDIERSLFANLVIAYEPVWAIGAKEPASPSECFEVVIALRRALASLVGIEHAKKVSILYGGSVTPDTAASFLQEGGVDGLLIGRASHDVKSFLQILESTS